MKILGISGTIVGSKTRIAVQKGLDLVKELNPDIEVALLDLKEYEIEFCDGRDPKTYTDDTKKVIDMVSSSDCYLIGTPVFHGTLPGTLKNLFDLIPVKEFEKKVIGFMAIGGNSHHYLMIENQLKPIAGYFKAYVATNNVFIHNSVYENNHIQDNETLDQISKLANEVMMMQKALSRVRV